MGFVMALFSIARRSLRFTLLLSALLPLPALADSFGSVTACAGVGGVDTQTISIPFKFAIRSILATTQGGTRGYFQISGGTTVTSSSPLLVAGFVTDQTPVIVEHVGLGASFAVNTPIGVTMLQVRRLTGGGVACVTVTGE
jgi:hypothetical protein